MRKPSSLDRFIAQGHLTQAEIDTNIARANGDFQNAGLPAFIGVGIAKALSQVTKAQIQKFCRNGVASSSIHLA